MHWYFFLAFTLAAFAGEPRLAGRVVSEVEDKDIDACVAGILERGQESLSSPDFLLRARFVIDSPCEQESQVVIWRMQESSGLSGRVIIVDLEKVEQWLKKAPIDTGRDRSEMCRSFEAEERLISASVLSSLEAHIQNLRSLEVPALPPVRITLHGVAYDISLKRPGAENRFLFLGQYSAEPRYTTSEIEEWSSRLMRIVGAGCPGSLGVVSGLLIE